MTPEEKRAKHAEQFAERQARVAKLKELTPEQRKVLIAEKKAAVEKLNRELWELKDSCSPHQFRELKPKELADEWMSVGSTCLICGEHFGWRCKVSPDGVCHYHTEDGKVELSDGTLVDPPAEHDPNYETSDSCIWCGHPDERK